MFMLERIGAMEKVYPAQRSVVQAQALGCRCRECTIRSAQAQHNTLQDTMEIRNTRNAHPAQP
jgi:hypothetical protein